MANYSPRSPDVRQLFPTVRQVVAENLKLQTFGIFGKKIGEIPHGRDTLHSRKFMPSCDGILQS